MNCVHLIIPPLKSKTGWPQGGSIKRAEEGSGEVHRQDHQSAVRPGKELKQRDSSQTGFTA